MTTRTTSKTLAGVRFELTGPKLDLGLKLHRNEEYGTVHIGLILFALYISSDAWATADDLSYNEHDYGWDYFEGGFTLHWRNWRWSFRPWGDWSFRKDLEQKTPRGTHPYAYHWKFKRDTVQHVTAEVSEEYRVWQWKIGRLMLPIYAKQRSLWCDFSEELGDQRKSWKGGITGSSFTMKPGETWADAYRRMQTEANFCRGK